jgi:hypothetical protein
MEEAMILIRFYFWLLVFHLATFYKQSPLPFFRGLVWLPFFFVKSMASPTEDAIQVIVGVDNLKRCWESNLIATPPKFVARRLEALLGEAQSQ